MDKSICRGIAFLQRQEKLQEHDRLNLDKIKHDLACIHRKVKIEGFRDPKPRQTDGFFILLAIANGRLYIRSFQPVRCLCSHSLPAYYIRFMYIPAVTSSSVARNRG